MSISILTVNTPKNCEECKVCVTIQGQLYCTGKGTFIQNGERDCSCPLVEAPVKLNMDNPKSIAYIEGWNDCRRRIVCGSSK